MATISLHSWSDIPKVATEAYARYGRWLPDIAAALAALIIGGLLAQLIWALIPTPTTAAWKPAPAASTDTRRSEPLDLNQITNAELFGKFTATPTVVAAENAPDTQLALTLLGIFADARDPKSSRALIGTAGGDEKPYAIGDDISRGVSLQAIFADRVVLSRNGRLETLRLDKDQSGSGDGLPMAADTDDSTTVDAGEAQQLADIRTKMLTDPSKAQDYIRVQPVQSPSGNGQLGYRIYPGKDKALFSAAGLRPGDVVTAINGIPLSDPAKSLQLLSDLSQSQQLSVVIDRGGQSQTVSVSLSP
ncbi:MAG: gspC [Nevskia sp.]|nr:gspC [Nevskia sp.]